MGEDGKVVADASVKGGTEEGTVGLEGEVFAVFLEEGWVTEGTRLECLEGTLGGEDDLVDEAPVAVVAVAALVEREGCHEVGVVRVGK